MVIENLEPCEFSGCDNLTINQVEVVYGTLVNVCEECEDKISNNTGYCNASCMLGYGCDDSC